VTDWDDRPLMNAGSYHCPYTVPGAAAAANDSTSTALLPRSSNRTPLVIVAPVGEAVWVWNARPNESWNAHVRIGAAPAAG
jgi:hypothetical protein